MNEKEGGWKAYVPGLALVFSVVGALLAAGSLIQKIDYLETESKDQARDISDIKAQQTQMLQALGRIDERTQKWAPRSEER